MNPIKRSWKIVGGGAALAAVGIAGFGFVDSGGDLNLPDAINLSDRVPISEAADGLTTPPAYEIVPAPVISDGSLDSPFDSTASFEPSETRIEPASGGTIDTASFDSPEGQVAPAPDAPVQDVDTASFNSPDLQVAPDPQYEASSFDSPDTSFASASFDSAGYSS